MHPESETKFWRLLADYETLTYRQAVALRHKNAQTFTEAQRLKATIFSVWLRLGIELGITRAANAELDVRLDRLGLLEDENRHYFEAEREAVRRRLGEVTRARLRLQCVRRNYQWQESPGAAAKTFAGQG